MDVLADPGTRDALMHSIQCCVPDATLLPAGIEALYLADPTTVPSEVTLHARERWRRRVHQAETADPEAGARRAVPERAYDPADRQSR